MALAHTIPDAVEAAYRRGDLFDKRRKLMAAWAAYCGEAQTAEAGKVILRGRMSRRVIGPTARRGPTDGSFASHTPPRCLPRRPYLRR